MTTILPRAAMAAIPLALAACGGGGGEPTAGDPDPPPVTYAITVGDTWVYKSEFSNAPETYLTRYVDAVAGDGSVSMLGFTLLPSRYVALNTRTVFDAQGRTVQEYDAAGGVCDYPPEASLGSAIQVGSTVDRSYTVRCGNSTTDYASQWDVQAREPKLTAAGTFDSYRYVRTVTGDAGATRTVSTCWIDVRLLRPVECRYSTQARESGGTYAETRSSTMALIGHQTAAYEQDVLHPARVAGTWTVTFSGPGGTNPRLCEFYFDEGGRATGGCEGLSTVSGGIVDDVITLQQAFPGNSAAQQFVSTSVSPVSMTGRWTKGADSGIWNAARRQP